MYFIFNFLKFNSLKLILIFLIIFGIKKYNYFDTHKYYYDSVKIKTHFNNDKNETIFVIEDKNSIDNYSLNKYSKKSINSKDIIIDDENNLIKIKRTTNSYVFYMIFLILFILLFIILTFNDRWNIEKIYYLYLLKKVKINKDINYVYFTINKRVIFKMNESDFDSNRDYIGTDYLTRYVERKNQLEIFESISEKRDNILTKILK